MAISKKIKTVIWDWNGTLLDDIDLCLDTINILLSKRKLPSLNMPKYKEVFSFPVKNYYEAIGFDFKNEPFEIPAREYIDIYNREVTGCNLHRGTVGVLEKIKLEGKRQVVLSAMEQNVLEQTLQQHHIFHFFDEISGLDNHYAQSKIDNGKILIDKLKLNPDEVCMVGDTIHDFEVSKELNCQCILVANGHQSEKRLKATGCQVLNDLTELYN